MSKLQLNSFKYRPVIFDCSGSLMGKNSMLIQVDGSATQISSEDCTKLLKFLIEREMRIHSDSL